MRYPTICPDCMRAARESDRAGQLAPSAICRVHKLEIMVDDGVASPLHHLEYLVRKAVRTAAWILRDGKRWIVDIDIQDKPGGK